MGGNNILLAVFELVIRRRVEGRVRPMFMEYGLKGVVLGFRNRPPTRRSGWLGRTATRPYFAFPNEKSRSRSRLRLNTKSLIRRPPCDTRSRFNCFHGKPLPQHPLQTH